MVRALRANTTHRVCCHPTPSTGTPIHTGRGGRDGKGRKRRQGKGGKEVEREGTEKMVGKEEMEGSRNREGIEEMVGKEKMQGSRKRRRNRGGWEGV
ncbi:hypothetical protein Pmani_027557 [Petrolisthes manimaculis]|uniref:Uncharacterized protein n=1 Tax=Petrolisthes manimaculis TaxID=1843537 RepID=A0AAE1P2E8_9EUCA|nr:hypothetical protein Pmani_027557 [Petrolisthes manimaculis]